jgi:hypothetical protein
MDSLAGMVDHKEFVVLERGSGPTNFPHCFLRDIANEVSSLAQIFCGSYSSSRSD